MTDSQRPVVGPDGAVDDDLILSFQIEGSNLRGRLIRLGGALDVILGKHAYPEPVARLLGETLTLAAALAATLKYEGVFTLQTKGDGPVRLVVADVVNTGAGDRAVRGYAQFDPDRLAADGGSDPMALLGKGYLAFTVDQGEHTERYQGIVELSGATLADCVQHYFRQSEQLQTGLRVAVDRAGAGHWRGGALMVQRLPADGAAGEAAPARPASDVEDDWRHAMVMMSTATPAELTDSLLPAHDLLYRLFHETGVRVWPATPVHFGCRCSRGRVEEVLRSLPQGEVENLRVDGQVEVSCQFCNTTYSFDDAELARLYAS